ncbi:hypothetical protein EYF80_036669 [Liparis tanakae]|uniref:Uncharacterized protein n=1 Tax=Liparis tanakae TaxID=230148 RepID=A0A4Z2GIN1_9TELE|nr:hypothetical protein EYF80_036669 [Liparis tanakae]
MQGMEEFSSGWKEKTERWRRRRSWQANRRSALTLLLVLLVLHKSGAHPPVHPQVQTASVVSTVVP